MVHWDDASVSNSGSLKNGDEALLKLFYLALNNISKKWTIEVDPKVRTDLMAV